jgi:hypothetical protein
MFKSWIRDVSEYHAPRNRKKTLREQKIEEIKNFINKHRKAYQ